MRALRKLRNINTPVASGTFTRKEAGQKIASGIAHVHSHPESSYDENFGTTVDGIDSKLVSVTYPWEKVQNVQTVKISSSNSRYDLIKKVISDLKLGNKRGLREKLEGVLEELITNAIYHAYRNSDGTEKYERKNSIELPTKEHLTLKYGEGKGGYFISLTDYGGSLTLDYISKSFRRCYGSASLSQIDSKESGAGLGLYLVFEAVTHLKILTAKNKRTTISCWIGTDIPGDEETFSFNYYSEE